MSQLKYYILLVIIGLTYFLSAKLGLSFAFEQDNTSPIWPPSGLAIAVCIFYGYRVLPAIFIAALALNLTTNVTTIVSLGIALGNTFEALLATWLVLRYLHPYPFDSVRSLLVFSLIVVFSSVISASVGTLSLLAGQIIYTNMFWLLWSTWWLGDIVGSLVFVPLILTFLRRPAFWIGDISVWEVAALLVATCLTSLVVFNYSSVNGYFSNSLSFLIIPTIVWATIRFRQHGATVIVVFYTVVVAYSVLHGSKLFVDGSNNESLLFLQLFMAIITTTALALAASLDEKEKVKSQLRKINLEQEDLIEKRTSDLNESNLSLQYEVKSRENSTESLKRLLVASSLPSDQNYFNAITLELAEIYHTKYAFIGVFSDEKKQAIRTLSVRVDGKIADNFVYELEYTPCKDVLGERMELIPCNAASLYPKDEMLIDMGIDSYFGAAIAANTGEKIGIAVVMHDQPLELEDWVRPVLSIIASQISYELERQKSKQELKLAASVFEETVEAIVIYGSDRRILQVNPAFSKVTGYCEEESVGKTSKLFSSSKHPKEFYQAFWKAVMENENWQGEIWNQKKDGNTFLCSQTITVVKDADGNIKQFIAVFNDITKRKKAEEKIYQLAHYDALTELPNRSYFMEILQQALKEASASNSSLALLFIDLDHFKQINDSSGHAIGDLLLIQVATRLNKYVNENTIVSRLGGDEFTVLLKNIGSIEHVESVASDILQEISVPFKLSAVEMILSASIGFCSFPKDANTVQELFKNADIAMYIAKAEGRNKVKRFDEKMNFAVNQRVEIEREIRVALEKEQFILHYQPQLDLKTYRVIGCEALVRWEHPKKGMLPPDLFIPVAEESGLIAPLGDWVLEEACKQFMLWQSQGIKIQQIAVNLSARQFYNYDLESSVLNILKKTGMKPENLEFELTESMLMENIEETIVTMNKLKQLGIHLSIDDFGTGYSSMAYLKHFPIEKLKIDKSFIDDVLLTREDAAIVNSTISLGHGLGLTVIAEGVESEGQMDYLKQHGCEEIQGYYFSKPLADSVQLRKILLNEII